jgi:hypothetical protein
MTEAEVERILHKPNPWLTLIPFWVVSGALMLAVGAITLVIMLSAAPNYHMNLLGEQDLASDVPFHAQDPRGSVQPNQKNAPAARGPDRSDGGGAGVVRQR